MKKIFLLICFIVFAGKAFSQFTAELTGYPLVTTGWNIGGFATVVDSTVELTTPSTTESGYVYYDSIVNLTACAQFTVDFDFQIIPSGFSTVADGIAFWYISNPPSGFITGGGIGLPSNPNGLIMILDTYDNDGDGNNPLETLLYYDGTIPGYTEGSPTGVLAPVVPKQTFIDDGAWHHCKIDYNAGNINVYFNYSPVASLTAYYSITISGYFGFSSSTGAAYSTQSVKDVFITAAGIAIPPTVTSPVYLCKGSIAAALSATGAGPFSWYTTDTATVVALPGAPIPNTSVVDTVTYYVRQGTGPCISPPDSIKVIINPLPVAPVITGTTTYCTGQTFVPFTVTATGTVLWYTAGAGGTGSSSAPVVNTAVAGTTTYWASQTVLGCEGPRASITVTVHLTPAPPVISGPSVYCQNESYIPPTATGTNILWYTAPSGGIGTIVVPTINTSFPGSYIIYATESDSGCESPRGPFNILVNPKPLPPVITDDPGNYCPGQPFVPFYVVAGSGILWYTAPAGGIGSPAAPTINTSIPGTYTQWASQTVLGCESDRIAVTVTVYDSVTSGFNYAVKYGCLADTVVFDNTSKSTTNYMWQFGDLLYSTAVNPTHIFVLQAIDTVKLYSSTATCIDSSIQYIDLRHPLHAGFVADTDLLCQGGKVTFTDTSIGTTPSYFWNFGDGFTDNSFNTTHTYLRSGVYNAYLVVSDFIPCHDTMFKKISVDTISGIRMNITDTVICKATYITFTGEYAGVGNTGVTWNFGNGDSIKNENPVLYGYDNTGKFTVTATAIYRVCPDTSVSRKVTVLPQPTIDLGPDTAICLGSSSLLLKDNINAGNPQATWLWNTGETSAGITIVSPGIYSTVVKVGGCSAAGAVTVSNDCYMDIPNAFTPNGDGVNDYFYPRQYLAKGLVSFKMDIFNRWGELIFETTGLDGSGWDGRFNNIEQPEGVFIYVIDGTFKDGQREHHQGNVTLLR